MRPVVALLLGVWIAGGCHDERRVFSDPRDSLVGTATPESELAAGPAGRFVPAFEKPEPRAYDVSEGKRLYQSFNCVGCHGFGGGGSGPPLMDDEWIYGSDPAAIFATIVEGRPNGMPSFGGRLTRGQVWQLVAFVRSMSGLLPKNVSGGRSDGMQVKVQEQSTPRRDPRPSNRTPVP